MTWNYKIIDEDINCKCIVELDGTPVFCFNCGTKYIDTANEIVKRFKHKVNTNRFDSSLTLKEVFKEVCTELDVWEVDLERLE